jgi:O-antigen/teichoic acid export membrane protein
MTEASVPVAAPRRRILRGSVFELSTHGIQQVVRLGSNLITTRLLFPAAFGASSIVWALITALVMFTDIALAPMIIQHKRGDDPDFLNTAFTVQVVRGLALGLLMIALAHPVAWFYHEPALPNLIYLGSLYMLFTAFHSTSVYTLRRRLHLGWLNAFDLAQTLFGTGLTLFLAWHYRATWTLLAGTIVGCLAFAVTSHFLPVPYRNKFRWDRTALAEIRHFGRWIIASSVASFLGGQADRILMGRFLGTAWLGVYGIAIVITDAVAGAITRLIAGVMFPALTEAGRQAHGNVADLYYRLRARLDLLSMGATGLLAGMGGWFVHLLWDARYADAAWMLPIVFVRVGVAALVSSGESCLFALGHPRFVFQRSVARLLATCALVPAGWALGGVKGLIWGSVAAEAAALLVIWPGARSLGILRIRRELLSVGIFAAAFALGRLILPWLPPLHLR